MSIKTESFDSTFNHIHEVGTRLTIPIDDDEYMVYRVEIANHRFGSSSLVTFYLDRYNSHPEHKTVRVDVIEQMRGDVQKRLRDNPEF